MSGAGSGTTGGEGGLGVGDGVGDGNSGTVMGGSDGADGALGRSGLVPPRGGAVVGVDPRGAPRPTPPEVGVTEPVTPAGEMVATTRSMTPLSTPSTVARRARWSRATRPQSAPASRNAKVFVHRLARRPLPPSAIDAPTIVSPADRLARTRSGRKPSAARRAGTTDSR